MYLLCSAHYDTKYTTIIHTARGQPCSIEVTSTASSRITIDAVLETGSRHSLLQPAFLLDGEVVLQRIRQSLVEGGITYLVCRLPELVA